MPDLDQDAIHASADLVGRTGATNLEVGHLHENVPVEKADWYAQAQYRGSRISVEHHAGPTEALEALVRRILTGAQCYHCKKLVALSDHGATAYDGHLTDGTRWTAEQAAKTGQCRWHRNGARWVRGCEVPDA